MYQKKVINSIFKFEELLSLGGYSIIIIFEYIVVNTVYLIFKTNYKYLRMFKRITTHWVSYIYLF